MGYLRGPIHPAGSQQFKTWEGGMSIKAKLGAGVWDFLMCEDCNHYWTRPDVNPEWTDDPEQGISECPCCGSSRVVREERG